MTEPLFDDEGMYTTKGTYISIQAANTLRPLVKELRKQGYKNREVQAMLMDAVWDVCIDDRLD